MQNGNEFWVFFFDFDECAVSFQFSNDYLWKRKPASVTVTLCVPRCTYPFNAIFKIFLMLLLRINFRKNTNNGIIWGFNASILGTDKREASLLKFKV